VVRRKGQDLLERPEGEYAGFEDVTVRIDARTRDDRVEAASRRDHGRGLRPSQLATWETVGIFASERMAEEPERSAVVRANRKPGKVALAGLPGSGGVAAKWGR
jgi:hypothetical protein